MHTTHAPGRHRSSGRRARRFATAIGAVALAAAISGPVAAVPMRLDPPGGSAVSVDPATAKSTGGYAAKLRTTMGYLVLVFG